MDKDKREILETAYSYCNKLIQKYDEIIEDMKEGRYKGGEDLTDGLEGILWLADVLQHTKELQGISPDYEGLKETFSSLSNGIENEDYYYAAEVMENELMLILSQWFDAIEASLEEDGEQE